MKLFLGIPTGGSPAKPFIESLGHLSLPSNSEAFERSIVTGNFVPAQRDVILERGLEWNADIIAMCDDDMVLPPHALTGLCDLLQSDGRIAIAGALYYSRDGLRPMAVDGWEPDDTTRGWIPAFDDRTPVAVSGVGFGCIAIRAAAVSAFARPFFSTHIYVERSAGRVRVCDEDYLFCARVRAAGNTVVLHPGIRCGHYDRARDAIAPSVWESAEKTNVARVLTQTGDRFELVPLSQAPEAFAAQRHVAAHVVYIEAP